MIFIGEFFGKQFGHGDRVYDSEIPQNKDTSESPDMFHHKRGVSLKEESLSNQAGNLVIYFQPPEL